MLWPIHPLETVTCATRGFVVPLSELCTPELLIAPPQADVSAIAPDSTDRHNIFEQLDCLMCSSPGIEVSKTYKIGRSLTKNVKPSPFLIGIGP